MKAIKVIGILVVAFIGITGGFIYESESIPENAKIYVYPSQRAWAPKAFFIERDFKNQLADPLTRESAERWLSEQTEAVYKDVKRGGKYDGYQTFPVLLEEEGNVLRGWHGSLLSSWFFKKPRWDANGNWNW